MGSVNQTRPHCVNQMGKTHSKPLEARHGKGKAWARHGNGMLCVNRPLLVTHSILLFPPHLSSRASPCAITFQLDTNKYERRRNWSSSNLRYYARIRLEGVRNIWESSVKVVSVQVEIRSRYLYSRSTSQASSHLLGDPTTVQLWCEVLPCAHWSFSIKICRYSDLIAN